MKIFNILLLVFLFTSFHGFAQEFNAGIYGGIVASQLDGDTYEGYDKAGLITGAYINRYFTKKVGWQMGLRYAQKGSRRNDTKNSVFYKCNLQYMEMPLTMRYQHFKKLDFEAGVSLGYLLKAMESINGEDFEEILDPPFNKFELASIFGVNYHFNKKIAVGWHFSYSLLAIRPFADGSNSPMDKGQHNNLLYFTVGYMLSSWR